MQSKDTQYLSETIVEGFRRFMGWCPHAHQMKAKNSGDAGLSFRADTSLTKSPGPSNAGRSGRPREGLYDHTQRGFLIIAAVMGAIILILGMMFLFGVVWVPVVVLCIMFFVLAICSTLTVTVGENTLRLRFGPVGLIKKSWPLTEIDMVTTVTNPWYYGWGIRWTPHGLLYNVSGYGAVEVRLISGKTFRIGTDEPEALKIAIEQSQTP
jgi:hypothetical protein